MWVATPANTLAGKLAAYADPKRRGSKRQKDLLDLVRLVEAHPHLIDSIPAEVRAKIEEAMN